MMTLGLSGSLPRRGRHIARVLSAIGLAAIAGCSDAPGTSPLAPKAPDPNLLGTVVGTVGTVVRTVGTLVNGVLWTQPATQTTASATIGPEGGTFGIPGGVRVTVPRGAVSSRVNFSVTRMPGAMVAYDFQPHGTTFAVPLVIEQPAAGTNLLSLPSGSSVQAGYFPDASLLNQLLGTATVTEFEPTIISSDKSSVVFTVRHFSGYIVSWGRNGSAEQ